MTVAAFALPALRFGDGRAPYLSARSRARKVDAALSPVARILAMASEMAGTEQRAAIWFKHQPIPGWAGKTAYDLVREDKADKVLAYLEAARAGVYA